MAASLIGLSLTLVALGSQRPAWWALGIALLLTLAWHGWRNGSRAARWVALGMALGPLSLMLGLDLGHVRWGLMRGALVVASCALLGTLSFIALRRKPALATAALAWHLMLMAPVDFARQPHPGGPLVQPLRMGLLKPRPTPEEASQFVEGGCLVGGLEPIWVVTWQHSDPTP